MFPFQVSRITAPRRAGGPLGLGNPNLPHVVSDSLTGRPLTIGPTGVLYDPLTGHRVLGEPGTARTAGGPFAPSPTQSVHYPSDPRAAPVSAVDQRAIGSSPVPHMASPGMVETPHVQYPFGHPTGRHVGGYRPQALLRNIPPHALTTAGITPQNVPGIHSSGARRAI